MNARPRVMIESPFRGADLEERAENVMYAWTCVEDYTQRRSVELKHG